jgi:hypothetical protein
MTTLVRPAAWRDGGPPPVGPEACRPPALGPAVYTTGTTAARKPIC